jgi:hypothetical protein
VDFDIFIFSSTLIIHIFAQAVKAELFERLFGIPHTSSVVGFLCRYTRMALFLFLFLSFFFFSLLSHALFLLFFYNIYLCLFIILSNTYNTYIPRGYIRPRVCPTLPNI